MLCSFSRDASRMPQTPLSANPATPAFFVTQCSEVDGNADEISAAAAAAAAVAAASVVMQPDNPDQTMTDPADEAPPYVAAAPLDEATLAQVAATLHKISAESHVAAVSRVWV